MKKLMFLILAFISLKCVAQLDTTFTTKQIVLNIPDTVLNNTVIKRKAQLINMDYRTIDSKVVLNWNVMHYSDSLGSYGVYLGGLIPNRLVSTTADNSTMVNTNTGAFVLPDSSGNYPQNVPYIGQFSFFQRLAEYQPILVDALIQQYGQATNWNK